ncbi:arylsulfatase [Engelhardtia mirabilis]|uniref:Arylsulfatase n=1 Tax=Engelhardtia mirabilis TaxID=2528011 RepID=A0A518BHF8_9BACT|nr:Arylsulfatase precursor [Planctomycetes bacterium Pla133]QDV00745.1 Arylsulfatase precursor [Planctomycetes bacterium Pla86]
MLRPALFVGFTLAAAHAAAHASGQDAAEPRRSPNVVLFMADDLGWGEVGAYGQTKIRTPAMDRVADEGMRFTRAYSGSPVCAPSRCTLLGGLHTGHSIVRNNWEGGGWGRDAVEGQYPLPEGTPSLQSTLRAAGWATGGMGKWGLGGPGTSGAPELQGFDHFLGVLCQRVAHNFYPTHLWSDGERLDLVGNEWFSAHQKIDAPLEDEAEYARRYTGTTYATEPMIDAALEFVRAHREQPFFLYYPTPLPHVALQVPEPYVDAYPREWDTEAAGGGPYLGQDGYLPHPRPRAAYAGMISRADEELGRILDLLDELELAGDTIVIVTSDNGPTYAGGVDHEFFDSAGGLRGLKGSLYEGGIRVPFMVRWPGQVAAGSASDQPLYFPDVAPTVAALVGIDWSAATDGVSVAPTLLGQGVQQPRDYMYWEHGPKQALIAGPWKLLRTELRSPSPTVELYRLDRDPSESTDLAESEPQVRELLLGLLRGAHVPSQPFPLPLADDGQ